MRHLKSGRKLKRTATHRKATLAALCQSLITHKRIKTTLAKAKETKRDVERLVTRAKNTVAEEKEKNTKNVHARREVYKVLQNRKAVSELFTTIASKIGNRQGGYTRVIKMGRRPGDGAEMAILEFVDYNIAQETAAKLKEKQKAVKKKEETKKIQQQATESTKTVKTE
jgi:large subunit ribosomal protein L17